METIQAIGVKAWVHNVQVEWVSDNDPRHVKYLKSDINNLEQSLRYSQQDIEEYGREQVEKWIQQDQERLNDWKHGEWWHVAAVPKATIKIETDAGTQLTSTIKGPALGGVESDAPREHFDEIATDVLSQLEAELQKHGFPIDAIANAITEYNHTDNAGIRI